MCVCCVCVCVHTCVCVCLCVRACVLCVSQRSQVVTGYYYMVGNDPVAVGIYSSKKLYSLPTPYHTHTHTSLYMYFNKYHMTSAICMETW